MRAFLTMYSVALLGQKIVNVVHVWGFPELVVTKFVRFLLVVENVVLRLLLVSSSHDIVNETLVRVTSLTSGVRSTLRAKSVFKVGE